MGIKLHERTLKVQRARSDFKWAALDYQKEHGLTDVEMLGAVIDILEYFHKGWLRAERHPDDPDKKADEE